MDDPWGAACPYSLISSHTTCSQRTLGPVQVQTPSEPEPDFRSGSFAFRFEVRETSEPDPKSGSRFGKICPEPDQTGLRQHYRGQAEENALLDSGATENFVDFATVCRHRLGTKKLIVPRPVYNVDGTPNIHGTITQTCELRVKQGNKEAKQTFYVTNLGKDRFILGYPWFRAFTPEIDWANAELKGPKVGIETTHYATMERIRNYMDKKRQTSSMAKVECDPWSGVTAPEMECGRVEVKRTHTAADMAHKYVEEHGTTNVVLPEEFKRHTALFSEEER